MKFKKFFHPLFLCILVLTMTLCLTACTNQSSTPSHSETNSDVDSNTVSSLTGVEELRKTIASSDAIAGIIYLGYGENGIFSEEIKENMNAKGYWDTYPFLNEIDVKHCVQTDGYELYCIIPADPASKVEVSLFDAAVTNTVGEKIYEDHTGAPFLLLCNVSDIMPNIVVSISDSSGQSLHDYSPSISLKDGRVFTHGAHDPVVLDLTSYE